ncbi:MAG: ORF6N domain-containing protein [Planctomycetota bacterium]|jgi:hypothetical protein
MKKVVAIIPVERIQKCILLIRNHKVILDRDLATLYGVQTRDLNKAVSRNLERFPRDFMFQLSKDEFENLKFHFGTSSWGGTRKLPRAFTEQGIAMLSSVLRSKRAIEINIAIMRTFARLRDILADNAALRRKLEEHDAQIKYIFAVLGKMLKEPEKPREQFGFRPKRPKTETASSNKSTA